MKRHYDDYEDYRREDGKKKRRDWKERRHKEGRTHGKWDNEHDSEPSDDYRENFNS